MRKATHAAVVLSALCLCATLLAAPARGSSAPAPFVAKPGVNPVLGDASWVARFGTPPPDNALETQRIQVHLAYVEELLRARTTPDLSTRVRAARLRLVSALASYRIAGDFPHNRLVPGRRPRLIDEAGRLCAVGYLIAISAGRAAVEDLRRVHEHDYLLDIRDGRLAAWASQNGFTLEELAMIQPAYGRHWDEPPRILRPSRMELMRGFGALQTNVQRCAVDAKAKKRTLVTLDIEWPATDPLSFEADSTPGNDGLEDCVETAARLYWVRKYGSTVFSDHATHHLVLRYRVR